MSSVSASYVFFPIFLCKVDYHYVADWVSEADVQTVIQSARSSGRVQAAPRAPVSRRFVPRSACETLPTRISTATWKGLFRIPPRLRRHPVLLTKLVVVPSVARRAFPRFRRALGQQNPIPSRSTFAGSCGVPCHVFRPSTRSRYPFPRFPRGSMHLDAPRTSTVPRSTLVPLRATPTTRPSTSTCRDQVGSIGSTSPYYTRSPSPIERRSDRMGTRTHPPPPIFVDRMDREKRTHPSVPGAVRRRLHPLRHARWKGRSAQAWEGKRRTSLSDPRRISTGTQAGHPTDEATKNARLHVDSWQLSDGAGLVGSKRGGGRWELRSRDPCRIPKKRWGSDPCRPTSGTNLKSRRRRSTAWCTTFRDNLDRSRNANRRDSIEANSSCWHRSWWTCRSCRPMPPVQVGWSWIGCLLAWERTNGGWE